METINKRKYDTAIQNVFYRLYMKVKELELNSTWNDPNRDKFLHLFIPYINEDRIGFGFSLEGYEKYIITIRGEKKPSDAAYFISVADMTDMKNPCFVYPSKDENIIFINKRLFLLFILVITNEVDVSPQLFQLCDPKTFREFIRWSNDMINNNPHYRNSFSVNNFYDLFLQELSSLDIMKNKIKVQDILPPMEERMKRKRLDSLMDRFMDNLFSGKVKYD